MKMHEKLDFKQTAGGHMMSQRQSRSILPKISVDVLFAETGSRVKIPNCKVAACGLDGFDSQRKWDKASDMTVVT